MPHVAEQQSVKCYHSESTEQLTCLQCDGFGSGFALGIRVEAMFRIRGSASRDRL